MNKQDLVVKLVGDLRNEYLHMLFYLRNASSICGVNRPEYSEMFKKHAQSEMEHILEFSRMIMGLQKDALDMFILPRNPPIHYEPIGAIMHAISIEKEVVNNYVARKKEAEALGGVDGEYIALFLEDQILDSRKDVDEFMNIL